MRSARHLALRLALYLNCSDVVPVINGSTYKEYCAALNTQLMALETDMRTRGRREGRKLIREAPGLEKAAGHLVPVPPRTLPRPGRWQRRCDRYERKMRLWLPETPPCPGCRIIGRLAKRSYPTFAMAEEVCQLQNDPLLQVYACPVVPGYYHLGHPRPQNATPQGKLPSA